MFLEKPDMNPKCANKLFELASNANTILEWGSGGSTVAMIKYMKEGAVLYSYEHDPKFYSLVQNKINNNKVVYTFANEKEKYVNGPSSDIHYSLILVDGVYRQECLERVRLVLDWDILLLHDAERERYTPWMNAFSDELYIKSFVKNLWVCKRIK